jgi:hypothetical protein
VLLLPAEVTAAVKVVFPADFMARPGAADYEFAEFSFYRQGDHGISPNESKLPNHEPFLSMGTFFADIHSSNDSDALKNWFDVWNEDTRMGVEAFRKVPKMDLVAYWKSNEAWTILFSIGGHRDRSLVPMFLSLSNPPKFITDATNLGDFVGVVGSFLKQDPSGQIESIRLDEAGGTSFGDLETTLGNNLPWILLVAVVLAAVIAIVIKIKRK